MTRLSPPLGEAIVLTGMMGAGKSAVGAALAARLGWLFTDTDDEVSAVVGGLAAFIEEHGIGAARAHEAMAVASVCGQLREDGAPDRVVAVGGGTVLDPANRVALSGVGPVVWLRAGIETLLARVGDGAGRPLLAGDPEMALRALSEERDILYAAWATAVVDVDGLALDEVVSGVLVALERA